MLYVQYVYKPDDIEEVHHALQTGDPSACPTYVTDKITMTTEEYDEFVKNFRCDRSWCRNKGGIKHLKCLVIEVTAPNRQTLYIDPDKRSYPRYVGVLAN